MLVLPSWVESSELTGGNTEEDVIRRGFRFTPPEKGGRFTTGSISHQESTNIDSDSENNHRSIRKALLCQLGVGRALALDSEHLDQKPLPSGYDSVYLQDLSSIKEGRNLEPHDYRHVYYIENAAQILPQFLIHYDFDQAKERKSREVIMLHNSFLECSM